MRHHRIAVLSVLLLAGGAIQAQNGDKDKDDVVADELDEVEMSDDESVDDSGTGESVPPPDFDRDENPVDPMLAEERRKKKEAAEAKKGTGEETGPYPQRFIERPLTLLAGMTQVELDIPVSLTSDPFFANINLDARFAITDEAEIGLRYGVGALTEDSFEEGRTVSIDVRYQIKDWLAAQLSLPFYLDPFQMGLAIGVPMQGNIGPVRFFGGHDLIEIAFVDFFPAVENPLINELRAAELDRGTLQEDGNINLKFGGGYQHTDALTIINEWEISYTDFDTSQNRVATFLGAMYARGNMLDFMARIGFDDLTQASDTLIIGLLGRMRI